MSKLVFLLLIIFFSTVQGRAQHYAGSSSDNYGGFYYSPVLYGPNGFRSVEDEDALTERAIAEARRKRREDSMGAEGLAEHRRNHQSNLELNQIKNGLNAPPPKEEPKQPAPQPVASKPVSRFSLQSFYH